MSSQNNRIDDDLLRRQKSQILVSASELLSVLERHHTGINIVSDDVLEENYKTNAHMITLTELKDNLHTDFNDGLINEQVKDCVEKYGYNKLSKPKSKNIYLIFLLKLFTGLFNIVLWIGAILSFIAYAIQPTEGFVSLGIGIVLICVIFITTLFVLYQESHSRKILDSFKTFESSEVCVMRNGELTNQKQENLVPGDVLLIHTGDKIPADVRIIECSSDFAVDNSTITGESESIPKSTECTDTNPAETMNLAFYGTLCVQGYCKAVVYLTGDTTMMGRIAKLANSEKRKKSTISIEVDLFIKKIAIGSIILGLILFIIMLATGFSIAITITNTIAIAVANIPEGLIATVAVSLGLTAKKLAKKNVNIKDLECIETLGCTSVICSDKTGTITQNIMEVSHIYCDFKIHELNSFTEIFKKPRKPIFESLIRCSILCSNATYNTDGIIVGDATEKALLKFSSKEENYNILRAKYFNRFSIPFNSKNKWQLSIHEIPDEEYLKTYNSFLVVLKGATDRILDFCYFYYNENGECLELTNKIKEEIFSKGVNILSEMGERVLCFCEMKLSSNRYSKDYEFKGNNRETANFDFARGHEMGFAFIGLISLIDPERPEVAEAVQSCHSAGIKVIMVTGDHPITAKAISEKVFIINGPTIQDIATSQNKDVNDIDPYNSDIEAVVIPGSLLEENMQKEENDVSQWWDMILQYKYNVFARTSPQQKLLIVNACQERGFIVASTGDGVNDAPALKKANVGISMGITGTDVAKEASNIILLDDNFATIVVAIKEGRIVFDNIKKSIAYALCSKIAQFLPFFFMAVIPMPLSLTIVMVLIIDLLTDIAPAIIYAYEPEELNCMEKPPRKTKHDKLVTVPLLLWSYFQIGILQFFAGEFSFFSNMNDYNLTATIILSGNLPSTKFYPIEEDKNKYMYLCCYNNTCSFYPNTCANGYDQEIGELDVNERKNILQQSQTAYFLAIVFCQLFTAITCKSKLPLWMGGIYTNKRLWIVLIIQISITMFIIYTPGVNSFFGLKHSYWGYVWGSVFGVVILLYNELRKFILCKIKNKNCCFKVFYW